MSIATPPPAVPKMTKGVSAEMAHRELEARIQETRDRAVGQRKLVGVCGLVIAFAAALGIVAVADYFLELALAYRTAWLVGVAMYAAAAVFLGWKRWIASYTLSQAAIAAESQFEQLGQRLRTTLDYDQSDRRPAAASAKLVAALHSESFHVVQKADWDEVIDRRPLIQAAFGAVAIGCVWFVALIGWPEFRTAAARALLFPAEYTTVTYSPESETVRFGESVTVKADVVGRPIKSAQLRYRLAGAADEWTTVDLTPPEVADEDESESAALLLGPLAVTLDDLRQDIEFEVIAGPRTLPAGSIRVLQPLTLEKSQAHVVPPEYTGKPDETIESLDLKVLEGSTIELTLELNRAAGEAKLVRQETTGREKSISRRALAPVETVPTGATAQDEANRLTGASAQRLIGDVEAQPETPLTIDGNFVRGTISDLRKNAAFSFSAQAADGMSLEPVRFNIRVQLDRKPKVEFVEPPEELVVTPTTDVPMLVEADDDIGLFKVGLMYQVSGGPMETLLEQNADGSTELFNLPATLMLEQHSLSHQDSVTYYAFAEDNYFGQPRRTTTPLRFIDIRPFKLAFQLLDTGGT